MRIDLGIIGLWYDVCYDCIYSLVFYYSLVIYIVIKYWLMMIFVERLDDINVYEFCVFKCKRI